MGHNRDGARHSQLGSGFLTGPSDLTRAKTVDAPNVHVAQPDGQLQRLRLIIYQVRRMQAWACLSCECGRWRT